VTHVSPVTFAAVLSIGNYSATMGKISKIGPGTEGGKLILEDFKNWRKTGFKPWVKKGLGGSNHWKSRRLYQSVSLNAFRSQAKKIADIAVEQMPAEDIEDGEEEDDDTEENEDDEDFPNDSENRNQWHRTEYAEEESDDEDEDFEGDDSQEEDDDLEEFEDIAMTELIDSRSTLVIEYPNGKKIGIVFVCDGDVKDLTSNQFEFGSNQKQITRLVRVPKERSKASALIGDAASENGQDDDFGFSDADLMVLDGVIQKRLAAGTKRDDDGEIWEVREKIDLPFPCAKTLYNKKGKRIKKYMVRRNRFGFTWGYFWLLAVREKPRIKAKRISGVKVSVMEDSSAFTEVSA
jgi:hypothetical protein